jgi:hypothetical protein
MKRLILPLVLVLILAGAVVAVLRLMTPHARQVATWLPGTTILLEDMPDLHRTAQRWPATALAQIIAEPEVQAFLQRPLTEIPRRADLDQWLAQAQRIDPEHFFLAVTDWSGAPLPSTIAGLYFSGSRQDLDSLVDDLRKQAQETWPAGKSDIEKYGSGDIETFTTPTFSAALAYRGKWLFISTDAAPPQVHPRPLRRPARPKQPGGPARLQEQPAAPPTSCGQPLLPPARPAR